MPIAAEVDDAVPWYDNRFRLPRPPRAFLSWASSLDAKQREHVLLAIQNDVMRFASAAERQVLADVYDLTEAERRVLSSTQWESILWMAANGCGGEPQEYLAARLPPRPRRTRPQKRPKGRKR